MGKAETTLTNHMRKDAKKIYGERIIIIKQHGTQFSRSGASDLLGCLDGTFFACEVKAPDSYGGSIERAMTQGPTVLQLAFISHVQVSGGYGWVAVTREQFLEGLAAIDSVNRSSCAYCIRHERLPAKYDACVKHPANAPAGLD